MQDPTQQRNERTAKQAEMIPPSTPHARLLPRPAVTCGPRWEAGSGSSLHRQSAAVLLPDERLGPRTLSRHPLRSRSLSTPYARTQAVPFCSHFLRYARLDRCTSPVPTKAGVAFKQCRSLCHISSAAVHRSQQTDREREASVFWTQLVRHIRQRERESPRRRATNSA